MKYKFKHIEDLLECAENMVNKIEEMFPSIDREDMKAKVLLHLLKNSILQNPHAK